MKLVILCSAAAIAVLATAQDAPDVTVWVDGTQVQFFDSKPVYEGGRVLVPLRGVFEELGATVEWDGATKRITAKKLDRTIVLELNNPSARVNEAVVLLDVAPQIRHERVLVPLRFVAEAFGANVEWEEETATVLIKTFPPPRRR